jgi:hypothetical protein
MKIQMTRHLLQRQGVVAQRLLGVGPDLSYIPRMPVLISAEPSSLPVTRPAEQRDAMDRVMIVSAIGIFSILSVTMAVISKGFLEGDACSHFLIARAAFANPAYLVNVWGRPFCTGLYALPAHFGGRVAVRITSLVVAIAIALVTRSIARGQGWRWPTLALIFLLAQPLVFLHSFSEMTELPFALLVSLGFLAYQRRQFFWMALVMGFGPLSRPEGFGFLALVGLALVLHRRWWWTAVLLMPVVMWDLTGWHLYGSQGAWWHWLPDNWPYAAQSLYERGPLLHFVMLMPVVVSPFIFPATVVGGWLCLKFTNLRSLIRDTVSADHLRRCEILIAGLPLLVLVGHSLLYWLGKMASNGEVRYMMVVAPFWALLGLRGWTWIFDQMHWHRPVLWAAAAAMLPVLANRAFTVIPMDDGRDWVEAQQIADWYKTSGIEKKYPHLEISHVGLQYALDLDPESGQIREWKKSVIDARPPGTLLIWDRVGALFNSDASRKVTLEEIRAAGWIPLKTRWTNGAGEWEFFESESR